MTATWHDRTDAPEEVVTTLQRDGVAFISDVIPADQLPTVRAELKTILADSPLGAHEYLGVRTRRTGRLFAKTRSVDDVATDRWVLEVLEGLIGEIQLTAPSAIEILPGEVSGHWHYDDVFYPLGRPHPDIVCNVFIAIDDFSAANGGTRIAVGSNHWVEASEPSPNDPVVVAEVPAGSAVMMTGATIHSAGANTTESSRIGLALEYCAAWLRPQENLVLSVPPSIASATPERLQQLLGYLVTGTGLGHVGGEQPTVLFEEPAGR